jgi:hypothetical protein
MHAKPQTPHTGDHGAEQPAAVVPAIACGTLSLSLSCVCVCERERKRESDPKPSSLHTGDHGAEQSAAVVPAIARGTLAPRLLLLPDPGLQLGTQSEGYREHV